MGRKRKRWNDEEKEAEEGEEVKELEEEEEQAEQRGGSCHHCAGNTEERGQMEQRSGAI